MSGVGFVANGKRRVAESGATVADVLVELHLAPSAVIIERNGEPLERRLFGSTRLVDGDRLEIAQMVGGG